MKKKAQISQVFVWIIVALVIGAVALIGAKSIGGLLKDKCSIDRVRFQDSMKEAIAFNNDYGSVNREQITAPCNYEIVCVVDARYITGELNGYDVKNALVKYEDLHLNGAAVQSIIKNSVDEHVEANVFLLGKDVQPITYISQIRLSDNDNPPALFCARAKAGRFDFKLVGQGRTTLVQEP